MRVTRREFGGAGLITAAALAGGTRLLGEPAAAAGIRLGLVTYNVAKDWDLGTMLRLCGEAGFEGVEFRTTHAHGVEKTLTPVERAEVRRRCADAGPRQTSLGTVCEFHSPNPEVVRRQLADCRAWVLLAKDIGARGVKVRPNGLPKAASPASRSASTPGPLQLAKERLGCVRIAYRWSELETQERLPSE